MHRAYVYPTWIDNFESNPYISLPEEVVTRFVKIVRVRPQEVIEVFDGCGRAVRGILDFPAKQNKINFLKHELILKKTILPKIILFQAALIEKKAQENISRSCEFGIDEIYIFDAQRSLAHSYEKLIKRRAKFELLAQDAARQSGRYFVPKLNFLSQIAEIKNYNLKNFVGIFGGPESKNSLSGYADLFSQKLESILICVGPEGGFESSEIGILEEANFIGVRWGNTVLRSELAALAPMSIINNFLGRA